MVEDVLAETQCPADRLELEITESVIMDNPEAAALQLLTYMWASIDRRFRHRLFQPKLSEAVFYPFVQDRPLVRARHSGRQQRRGHRHRRHRAGAQH